MNTEKQVHVGIPYILALSIIATVDPLVASPYHDVCPASNPRNQAHSSASRPTRHTSSVHLLAWCPHLRLSSKHCTLPCPVVAFPVSTCVTRFVDLSDVTLKSKVPGFAACSKSSPVPVLNRPYNCGSVFISSPCYHVPEYHGIGTSRSWLSDGFDFSLRLSSMAFVNSADCAGAILKSFAVRIYP